MSNKETLKINEKYTVVLDQDVNFKFYATRNGEQWRDLTGDNLILAMFQNLTTITQQYNAVVAQNKSLQSELNIYKKSLEKAAEDILFLLNHSNIFDYKYYESKEEAIVDYKKQALQELEAEND